MRDPFKKNSIVESRQLILAPLRGFTDVVFRNAFHRHCGGVCEAVAPFIASIPGGRVKRAHLKDLLPEENRGMPVVPQILGNDPDAFVRLADAFLALGYREVNWNLGCPFPMVAKKKRGSGLLPYPQKIDAMLERIFLRFSGQLSVKTRLGRFSADEIKALIPVFNRYPLARVIVHPRTGVQLYTGSVDLEAFGACSVDIVHPVVYNGDITDLDSFHLLSSRFPTTKGWMLGRGLLANPFLPQRIQNNRLDKGGNRDRFVRFHDALVQGYRARFSADHHVLDRMKGFWGFFSAHLKGGRRIVRQIRETTSLKRYREIVGERLACIARQF